MALTVNGVKYYTTMEVIGILSLSRQTLWRWRSEGKVPPGRRFRDKNILFTESEFRDIQKFANRIELVTSVKPQLKLFDYSAGGGTNE